MLSAAPTCCLPQAKQFYQQFVEQMKAAYAPERVQDGVFGAMMNVALENDGPVTFVLDSGHQGH
jgi:D-tyrosyl-tRNA(Tyr) deacylase